MCSTLIINSVKCGIIVAWLANCFNVNHGYCRLIIIAGYYQYTADQLAIDRCRPSNSTTRIPMGGLAAINTPLQWQAWERALRTHPDKQFTEYVVSGLREGFRVGIKYPRPCRSSADNMHSVREHAQVVRDYLSNE